LTFLPLNNGRSDPGQEESPVVPLWSGLQSIIKASSISVKWKESDNSVHVPPITVAIPTAPSAENIKATTAGWRCPSQTATGDRAAPGTLFCRRRYRPLVAAERILNHYYGQSGAARMSAPAFYAHFSLAPFSALGRLFCGGLSVCALLSLTDGSITLTASCCCCCCCCCCCRPFHCTTLHMQSFARSASCLVVVVKQPFSWQAEEVSTRKCQRERARYMRNGFHQTLYTITFLSHSSGLSLLAKRVNNLFL
jgi:hypothetical protein